MNNDDDDDTNNEGEEEENDRVVEENEAATTRMPSAAPPILLALDVDMHHHMEIHVTRRRTPAGRNSGDHEGMHMTQEGIQPITITSWCA
jgi:hypothetical protein